jgi:hypothetical protein
MLNGYFSNMKGMCLGYVYESMALRLSVVRNMEIKKLTVRLHGNEGRSLRIKI